MILFDEVPLVRLLAAWYYPGGFNAPPVLIWARYAQGIPITKWSYGMMCKDYNRFKDLRDLMVSEYGPGGPCSPKLTGQTIGTLERLKRPEAKDLATLLIRHPIALVGETQVWELWDSPARCPECFHLQPDGFLQCLVCKCIVCRYPDETPEAVTAVAAPCVPTPSVGTISYREASIASQILRYGQMSGDARAASGAVIRRLASIAKWMCKWQDRPEWRLEQKQKGGTPWFDGPRVCRS